MELKDKDAEQGFARCLQFGTAIALVLISLELAAYLSGLLSPYIPLRDLPAYWRLPLKEYLAAAQVPAGWGWLELVWKGDYVNFIGIALLASISAMGCAAALRAYATRGETAHALLAAAQVLVLLAAASGLLNSI